MYEADNSYPRNGLSSVHYALGDAERSGTCYGFGSAADFRKTALCGLP